MTEIQWLVDIMMNFKLPSPVKDRFIARIGEVEALLSRPGIRTTTPVSIQQNVQAPSTQRILDDMLSPTVQQHQATVINRNITPSEVITSKGNGTSTKGPRKW